MANDELGGEPTWLVPPPANRPRAEVVARLEDLETALRAQWSDDMLAVYADQLQLIGDPRGELIALDLTEDSHDSQTRRGELLRQWFAGNQLEVWWSEGDHCWFAGSRRGNTWLIVERGLIEAVHVGDAESRAAVLRLFLETPKSELVHRMSISGSSTTLRLVLAALASRQRPWLRSLAIKRLADDDREPLIDGDALVTTLPNLTSIELDGRRLLDRLDHGNLTELVLTGHDALDLSTGEWASVTAIDYAHLPGWARVGRLGSLLSRDRFPRARRLDFARVTPAGALFSQLRELDLAGQLSHLVLPALRAHIDVENVQAALDRMPALRELEIDHAYMCFGQLADRLHHPAAKIEIPTPWPWPPREQLETLVVDGRSLPAEPLIAALEDQFADLPEDIQAIWCQFWIRLARIGASETIVTADLRAALDELTLDDARWVILREELIVTSLDDAVVISVL